MRVNLIIFGLIINYCSGELYRVVRLSPSQSTTIVNNSLVIYKPSLTEDRQELDVCKQLSGEILHSITACKRNPITGMMNELFDYKFLNGPDSADLSSTTFMFGSIRYQYLNQLKTTVNSRFSQLTGYSEGDMKKGYSYMPEPGFTFPDIDYSVSLIGEPDITKSSSDASLYVLGGAKYFQYNRTLSMINNFSLFSFEDNTWKDLSSNLPPPLKHIGGHEMVNIENSKLAILGGYKTSNYSFDIGLSAIDPEFRDFKNLFIYDIKKNEWERKVTIISQQDSDILSLRQQYSCTAVYRNNAIYAYAGFYIEPSKQNLVHLFGILDFESLVWKWKQVHINDPSYENANSTHFDSILLQKYMIVNQFNATNSDSAKLIPFDLNIEEIDTYINYDPTDSSRPSNFKHYKTPPFDDEHFPLAAIIITSIVASIAALIIIFLIYRYIRHSIKKKSSLNYETKEVWSDSNSFFKHFNSSAIFSYSKTNANYQGSIIEHFDTNMTMSASYLEQTVETSWEKNTLLTRQIFDSHTNSFQTSGTLVHQRGKPYNGNAKDTEFSDNWDAYSTY